MCRPDHFGVYYAINKQMRESRQSAGGKNPVNRKRALSQWQNLTTTFAEEGVYVQLIKPVKGLPDLVFTANAGLKKGNIFVVSNFRHPERRGEEAIFRDYFGERRFHVCEVDDFFEGHGDALYLGGMLFCGHGFRSTEKGVKQAAERVEDDPVLLKLVDEEFYHLDTCFCPIGDKIILYYPSAFDRASRRKIEALGETVAVSKEDARNFVCNNVPVRRLDTWKLIGAEPTPELRRKLEALGVVSRFVDLSEFRKSGGGARCLSFFL